MTVMPLPPPPPGAAANVPPGDVNDDKEEWRLLPAPAFADLGWGTGDEARAGDAIGDGSVPDTAATAPAPMATIPFIAGEADTLPLLPPPPPLAGPLPPGPLLGPPRAVMAPPTSDPRRIWLGTNAPAAADDDDDDEPPAPPPATPPPRADDDAGA